ncbi:hypothetical protein [Microbispora triticiradicis]|uniref:hypothetical protein n=1 Tax=Microbispora triticiradicis TaxID=2200763 RepID=UPI001404BFAA|nr:hypothetical protein [Microbispora triticiradicis]
MARQTVIHHIPKHAGWPDGERPSGWPGSDPGRNVRDEYDKQQADTAQQPGQGSR